MNANDHNGLDNRARVMVRDRQRQVDARRSSRAQRRRTQCATAGRRPGGCTSGALERGSHDRRAAGAGRHHQRRDLRAAGAGARARVHGHARDLRAVRRVRGLGHADARRDCSSARRPASWGSLVGMAVLAGVDGDVALRARGRAARGCRARSRCGPACRSPSPALLWFARADAAAAAGAGRARRWPRSRRSGRCCIASPTSRWRRRACSCSSSCRSRCTSRWSASACGSSAPRARARRRSRRRRSRSARVNVSVQSLLVVGTSVALIGALALFFGRTLYGKALRATAVNRAGARLCGISPRFRGRAHVRARGAAVRVLRRADRPDHHGLLRLRLPDQPQGLRRRDHRRPRELSDGRRRLAARRPHRVVLVVLGERVQGSDRVHADHSGAAVAQPDARTITRRRSEHAGCAARRRSVAVPRRCSSPCRSSRRSSGSRSATTSASTAWWRWASCC